jgi:hypothetical protein
MGRHPNLPLTRMPTVMGLLTSDFGVSGMSDTCHGLHTHHTKAEQAWRIGTPTPPAARRSRDRQSPIGA